MNGKMRVSIVATALNGSEVKPYLNLVNTQKQFFFGHKINLEKIYLIQPHRKRC